MKATPLPIPDVLLIEPEIPKDDCGSFHESYNQTRFVTILGKQNAFVQDSHSCSGRNAQILQPQVRLMRETRGEVFDVIVDIRKSSPIIIGQWGGKILSTDKCQVQVRKGFARDFVIQSDGIKFFYKTIDYYAPGHEYYFAWVGPAITIRWSVIGQPVLTSKDPQGKPLPPAEHFA